MKEKPPANKLASGTPITSGIVLRGFKAKYYDIGNAPFGVPLVIRAHVRLISLQPGQSLLDIGSGSGEALYQLHRKFGESVFLHGIDPSSDTLCVARRKLRKATNVLVELGVSERLRFSDNSFDWVVSFLTYHHLPLEAKRATIRESRRVLKPGGKFLISDFGKWTNVIGWIFSSMWSRHAFTSENLKNVIPELLLGEGFSNLSVSIQAGVPYHTVATS
jgi:ubiquinone/menaquinone biosynthesis C-methylase UbiE